MWSPGISLAQFRAAGQKSGKFVSTQGDIGFKMQQGPLRTNIGETAAVAEGRVLYGDIT
ncbi:hypothetical protein PSAC2689_150117 [Paraburkholderia sacchari]